MSFNELGLWVGQRAFLCQVTESRILSGIVLKVRFSNRRVKKRLSAY